MAELRSNNASLVAADDGLPSERFDCSSGIRPTKRNHFNRKGHGLTEHRCPFGLVRDNDNLSGGSRHDLFAQKRAPATFDQIEPGIDLIRAVDRHIDLPRLLLGE